MTLRRREYLGEATGDMDKFEEKVLALLDSSWVMLRQRSYLAEKKGDLEDMELQKSKLGNKALRAFPSSPMQREIQDEIRKIEVKIKKARIKRGVPDHYRFEPRKQKCDNCGMAVEARRHGDTVWYTVWCGKWNAFVKSHYTCDDWSKK